MSEKLTRTQQKNLERLGGVNPADETFSRRQFVTQVGGTNYELCSGQWSLPYHPPYDSHRGKGIGLPLHQSVQWGVSATSSTYFGGAGHVERR